VVEFTMKAPHLPRKLKKEMKQWITQRNVPPGRRVRRWARRLARLMHERWP